MIYAHAEVHPGLALMRTPTPPPAFAPARRRGPGPWAGAALLLAGLLSAAPGVAQVPRQPLADHRELKLLKREIGDDRRDLERLDSRLARLEALRTSRWVDRRAIGELDAVVQAEMQREALEHRLEIRPAVKGEVDHRHEALVKKRTDQITLEWAALYGRFTAPELKRRCDLLAELARMVRRELVEDIQLYLSLGGDPDFGPVGSEPDEEAGSGPAPEVRKLPVPR